MPNPSPKTRTENESAKPFANVTEDMPGRVWFLSILFVPLAVVGIPLVLSPLRLFLADRATVHAVGDHHAVRLGPPFRFHCIPFREKVWEARSEPIRRNLRNGLSSVQCSIMTTHSGGSGYLAPISSAALSLRRTPRFAAALRTGATPRGECLPACPSIPGKSCRWRTGKSRNRGR